MSKIKPGCSPPIYVDWQQGPRDYQEDYFGVSSDGSRSLLVVADGMGGHSSGDQASRWTVEELSEGFKKFTTPEDVFGSSIRKVVKKMREAGKDMGCTLVACYIEKKEDRYNLTYTWVGDSRLYLVAGDEKPSDNAKIIDRGDGRNLWLLSDDDSFVWGFLLNEELTIDQLTQHPNKNQLEYSIHPRQEEIDVVILKRMRTVELKPGDRVFLCTDGVWESYPFQAEILSHITHKNPTKRIQGHLKTAMKDGRFADNGTYILAEMQEGIFNQECYPKKGKHRFFGPFAMAFIGFLLFTAVFLTLIGKIKITDRDVNPIKPPPVQGEPALPVQPYAIEVGTFPTCGRAEAFGEEFRRKGFPVAVAAQADGIAETRFVVKIGNFRTRHEAVMELNRWDLQDNKKYSVIENHSRGDDGGHS
jgi:protein phosphatase